MSAHKYCHQCAGNPINGILICPADGKNASRHAAAMYCPKDPPLFGDGIEPLGWDELQSVPRTPLPVVELTDQEVEEEQRRLKAGGCCGSPSQ